MIYKPILFWVVAPSSISHRALGVSALSLRSLTREFGSIGFYQTHVSNSSQLSNEPPGSERAGDEGRQIRKLRKRRKREGKVKAKVREIITEGVKVRQYAALLKEVRNWSWGSYWSNSRYITSELPFWVHFINLYFNKKAAHVGSGSETTSSKDTTDGTFKVIKTKVEFRNAVF